MIFAATGGAKLFVLQEMLLIHSIQIELSTQRQNPPVDRVYSRGARLT